MLTTLANNNKWFKFFLFFFFETQQHYGWMRNRKKNTSSNNNQQLTEKNDGKIYSSNWFGHNFAIQMRDEDKIWFSKLIVFMLFGNQKLHRQIIITWNEHDTQI